MRAKSLLWMLTTWTVSVLSIFGLHTTEAKKLTLQPLSARQVYSLLRTTGREDAVPEGRIVTQGLAALAGFNLGLTAGVGGALLFDLLTLNTTALLGAGGNTAAPPSAGETVSQEICFNTRSARNLQEAEAIAEAYSRLDNNNNGRDVGKLRRSEVPRKVKRTRRNKKRRGSSTAYEQDWAETDEARQVGTTVGTATSDLSTTPNTSGTTGTGSGTDTTSTNLPGTTTATPTNPPAINCIVINKPKQ